MTLILFCCEPFSPRTVDPDFGAEWTAARAAGFTVALVDHMQIAGGDFAAAVRHVPSGRADAIYRGWMMRASEYESFHAELSARGVALINDPTAYRHTHHLPESYDVLEGETPRTTWLLTDRTIDFTRVFEQLRPFGSGPIVVKDFVKSQKHAWNEACFVPRADDLASVERVVRRFVELQGEELAEGLVFREFIPFQVIGRHPRSEMPLAAEVRTLWMDGQIVLSHPYWGDLAAPPDLPPLDWMRAIAARVRSRFFTMDVALREDGRWMVIELGDGQVTGLPDATLAPEFYRALFAAQRGSSSG